MTRTGSRATKAEHVGMTMYRAEVRTAQHLTPHLKRVTLASDELRGFRDDGPDQRFKLLLPQPHQPEPVLPDTRENWYLAWKQQPDDVRSIMRTYTVRAARPADGELDVDVLVHEDGGPGSRWADRAGPGDQVGVFGAYAEYDADPAATQLIAGDHSALPAIAAILDRLSPGVRGRVVIEVPGPDEQLPLPKFESLPVTWVDARPDAPGAALTDAIRAELRESPDSTLPDYAWVAADNDTATALRRYLVKHRGLRPEQVMFMGYWRTDGPIDDD